MAAIAQQSGKQGLEGKCLDSNQKCVCQICTCKKHHCPPKHIAFNADTTNHELYKAYNVSPQRVSKGGYVVNKSHYDSNLIKSTYHLDYKNLPREPTRHQSKYAYQPNNAHFYDETEYKKSYVQNKIEVQKPYPGGAQYRPNSARFDGSTTYGAEFKNKRAEQTPIRKQYAYQTSDLPFNGHTTYGDSYTKYQVDQEKPSTCCHPHYAGNTGRFEGKTSYNETFRGVQNQQSCRCLIEQLPPRPRECSPGKDHIHFCAHQCNWK